MDDCSHQARFNSQVLKRVKTNDCLGICLKNNDISLKWLVIMYSLCDFNPNLNLCFSNVFFFGLFSFLAFIPPPPPPPTSLAPPISLAPPTEKDCRPRYERQKWYRHIGTLSYPLHYYLLSIVCVGTTGSRQMWVFIWSFTQKGR